MRSENGSNRKQTHVTRWAVAALIVGMGTQTTWVSGQDNPVPAWRQGVSRWTGSGYEMPVDAVPPAPLATPAVNPDTVISDAAISETVISEAPYTIPVDPRQLPSASSGMTVSGPSTQANPYFALPPVDEATSLELASPCAVLNQNSQPHYILPPQPIEPSVRNPAPLAEQDPIDRLETEVEILPAPSAALPSSNESATVEIMGPDGSPDPAPVDGDLPSLESPSGESMVEKIDVEPTIESGPLESEVVRWYQYPVRWMRGWDSHAELGIDGSAGNANTLAIQTGLETKRKTEWDTWALDVDYRQASNGTTTIEDNGRFNLDYDRLLHDSPWAGFGKFGMEWDKFKPFDLRIWGNGGVGYHWIRRDDASLVTRFGAGASKEIGSPDDAWIPEAIFGGEAERQLTSRQKVIAKVEYFPAWDDFGNFRLVNDLAWEILLDGSENLSLKVAATDRYDSTPQGAKKNDIYYSLLLLYKF